MIIKKKKRTKGHTFLTTSPIQCSRDYQCCYWLHTKPEISKTLIVKQRWLKSRLSPVDEFVWDRIAKGPSTFHARERSRRANSSSIPLPRRLELAKRVHTCASVRYTWHRAPTNLIRQILREEKNNNIFCRPVFCKCLNSRSWLEWDWPIVEARLQVCLLHAYVQKTHRLVHVALRAVLCKGSSPSWSSVV